MEVLVICELCWDSQSFWTEMISALFLHSEYDFRSSLQILSLGHCQTRQQLEKLSRVINTQQGKQTRSNYLSSTKDWMSKPYTNSRNNHLLRKGPKSLQFNYIVNSPAMVFVCSITMMFWKVGSTAVYQNRRGLLIFNGVR